MKKILQRLLSITLLASGIIATGVNYQVEASTTTPTLSQGYLYTDGYFTAYNKNHHKISMVHNKVKLVKVSNTWYKTTSKYKLNKVSQILYVNKTDVFSQKTYDQAEKDLSILLNDMVKKATVKKVRVYIDYNQAWEDQWQYTFKNELGVPVNWFQLNWDNLYSNGTVQGQDCSVTADNVKANQLFSRNVRLYTSEVTGFKNVNLTADAPSFISKDMKPVYVK